MAEILGLGVTHQPTLTAESVKALSLPRTLADPGMPPHLRDPANWPERMRREWSNDQGEKHAREHRAAIVDELRKARAVLDEFQPDVVIAFGDDQYENFREDVIPPFCVLAYDQHEFTPWMKGTANSSGAANYWNEPADKKFVVKGHKAAAKRLVTGLLEQSFDVSYAYRPLHVQLGHAFRNTVMYLDWDRKGFPYAYVPFAVNCYGRTVIKDRGYLAKVGETPTEDELDPPSPSPTRCYDLGAACVRALADSPWRVALIASSSWSHAFLTAKHYYLYPDHDADEALYRALQVADYATWRKTTLADVEASGQHEMLNWFCLVGAMAELGRKPDYTSYLESSVMNSNKVVATFRP